MTKEEIPTVFKLTSMARMFRYADFMAEINDEVLTIVKEMIPNFEINE